VEECVVIQLESGRLRALGSLWLASSCGLIPGTAPCTNDDGTSGRDADESHI
jgi:hypothetical protein